MMTTEFPQDLPGVIQIHRRTFFDNVTQVLKQSGIPRTSSLCTPIERIEDHHAEIFTCEFHPYGELLLSGGIDNQINICGVYGEEAESVMILSGHWGAVMEAHFSTDGSNIYSCSSDENLAIWDTFTGIKVGHLNGHTGCVNTMQCARYGLPLLCSGGDDATVRIWDVRQDLNIMTLNNEYNATACCFDDSADHVFCGGLEADIKIWDLRFGDVVLRLKGHKDAVTGVDLSPCGSYLLSHSIDNTLRVWDIRPSFTGERCLQVFDTNQQIVNGNLLRCAWSKDGTMVSAGSCEEGVPLWNWKTGVKLTELPGHESTVNDVDFHPVEPILVSASSDEYLFLHELVVGELH